MLMILLGLNRPIIPSFVICNSYDERLLIMWSVITVDSMHLGDLSSSIPYLRTDITKHTMSTHLSSYVDRLFRDAAFNILYKVVTVYVCYSCQTV